MPFEKGNAHARKSRLFTDALNRELAQYEDEKRGIKAGEARSAIAKEYIKKALDGDLHAAGFIVDRTDGKPHQSVDVDVEHSGSVAHVDAGVSEAARARLADILGSRQPADTAPLLPH